MRIFHQLSTSHEDVVHDLSYDFYGKRLASCSSDQHIKVWDESGQGDWKCTADWKAHTGSVWKVAWAHPEFGQVLASCSFDRTVCIWEEEEDTEGNSKWTKRATLVDSRDSVQDIKFAPRHLGLKLATCSSDGFVRIYEAIDVTNLSHWSLMEEFESQQKGGITCLSWNPSSLDSKPLIAVGSNDANVKIWEYNESYRRWLHVETLSGHTNSIHDVCWAPIVGRSYHYIATASKDQLVKIWKTEIDLDKQKIKAEEVASFDDHHAEVWRVEWNVTGTILASSGDDGVIRLFKTNFKNEWKSFSVIRGERDEMDAEDTPSDQK